MPKIPLYNQGMGSAVSLEAQRLSPRADVGAFTAPGRALAGLAEQTGDIAFRFGQAEKKAETDRIYNEKLLEYAEKADQFIANPGVRTIEGFNFRAREFQQGLDQDIDGLAGLTPSQRQNIKLNLNGKMQQRFSVGRASVFTKQQAERTDVMNKSLDMYISDYVKTEDPEMKLIMEAEVKGLLDSAREQGLNIKYDENSLEFEVYKKEALLMTEDETMSLAELKEKQQDANTTSNRYKGLTASQGIQLANIFNERIQYLETGRVVELNSEYNDNVASLSMPSRPGQPTRQDILNNIYSITDEMASLGQLENAEKLRLEAETITGNMEAMDFLAFADDTKVQELLDKNYGAMVDMRGTDSAYEAAFQYKNLQEIVLARKTAIDEDPALYITDAYKRKYGRAPTISEVVLTSQNMGIEDGSIKPLTSAQVEGVTESINNAETAEDVRDAFAALTTNPEVTPYVMRQVMGSGVSIAMNYVANNPNDPVSRQLFNAFRPDALQITPSKTARDLVRSIVISNDEVQTHNKSMLGGAYANFDSDDIVPSASDSRSFADHRVRHNDMITQLAIYMIQEDGKMLVGEEKITPSEIEVYVEQATSVYTSRYSYLTNFPNKNIALRIPKGLEPNRSTIQKGLEDIVTSLEPDQIHYSSLDYLEQTPEFRIEKQRYLDEIQDGYGWVMSNDGITAMLIDPQGGLVYQEIKNDLGEVEVVPITSDLKFAFEAGEEVELGEDIEARSVSPFVP